MSSFPEMPRAVVHRPRPVERVVRGQSATDGAGVRLTRALTSPLQRRLDPFLMLDAFGTDDPDDYIAGFPDHPHRGFETITCMLAGRMRHRDSAGNVGLLQGGDVQWMTAGRGVIHSEIPEQHDGRMEGFQLWLNLPAQRKMCEPWYRDIPAASIPGYATGAGARVRVIAGESHGVRGAVQREVTQPLILDVQLEAGGEWSQPLPQGHNAFVYVHEGSVDAGATPVPSQHMGIFTNAAESDGVQLRSTDGARLLLIAGAPLREPIVQYGPFVMNSRDEIEQALDDFRGGRFAREAA